MRIVEHTDKDTIGQGGLCVKCHKRPVLDCAKYLHKFSIYGKINMSTTDETGMCYNARQHEQPHKSRSNCARYGFPLAVVGSVDP